MSRLYDHCIIGAGIIGLSIAFRLAQRGQSVLILDRRGMGQEASRGNAGAFAFADVEPLASPGVLRQSPRWLLDPLGPLSLPRGYAPKMLPWRLRFWRASWPENLAASTRAQAALMALAKAETEPLFTEAGLAQCLRRDGALYLYEGARALEKSRPSWDLKQRHGVGSTPVSGAELAQLQPGLGARYSHAMFVPGWMTVSDPYEVTLGIGTAALALGAEFALADVRQISPGEQAVSVTCPILHAG